MEWVPETGSICRVGARCQQLNVSLRKGIILFAAEIAEKQNLNTDDTDSTDCR